MDHYTVISSIEFREEYERLTAFEKERISRLMKQLAMNGSLVGKPLAGRPFFREKKYNGNRLYFLVYEEWKVVLAAATGPKKLQQKIISEIVEKLPHYKEYVREILKNENLI